ncbi:MAG: hypothetical protein ACO1OO_03000 [Flavisolibacter sp.]
MKGRTAFFLLIFLACLHSAPAQDVPIASQKFIYFPHPLNAGSRTSLGFISTVMPNEITEEVHYRIPAADVHVMKKIAGNVDLDARLLAQGVQNMVMAGPKWSFPLTDRISAAVSDQLGFWFGFINAENIRTKGSGFQNYPGISVGYRFNKSILVSLKAESIMNFGIRTKAGNIYVKSDYRLFSGSAYTLALEQPFTGGRSMTLGFRAIYTDYYWQTWTLFENYDRNLFFPQIIVGLIL